MQKTHWAVCLVLISGCASPGKDGVLSREGENVATFTGTPSRSCTFVGEVAGRDQSAILGNGNRDYAYTRMLNKAGQLGANRLQITKDTGEGASISFKGNAFKCSNYAHKTNDEILKGCEQKSGDACFELGLLHYNGSGLEDAVNSMELACDYKFSQGCEMSKSFTKELARQQKILALGDDCLQKSKGQACLDLTVMANEDGYKEQAMRFAQQACSKGKAEGCSLYTQYSQEQIALQNQALQQRALAQTDQIIQMQALEMQRAQSERNARAWKDALNSMYRQPAHQAPTPSNRMSCRTKPKYGLDGSYQGSETECQ